jgi:adenylate kinase family enzyme
MRMAQDEAMMQCQGILLLGPTGAGKSPLGDRIEAVGLGTRRFCHFDFGANLRRAATREGADADFLEEEREFLRSVLRSGALLENDRFPLAERILRRFLEERCREAAAEVVLNGLPRHVGQAEAVGRIVHVHTVVSLRCSEEVVARRIGTNVGGDRSKRSDDSDTDIRRKLAIFAERTGPLVDYYRRAGRLVIDLPVTAEMTPESAWCALRAELEMSGF